MLIYVQISWYNEKVAPVFRFDLPGDTIAFIVISRPDMFEKAFMPFITKQDCLSVNDPIDECVAHHFARVKEVR
jgi:methylmalonic aciduria homocystinuria type C protein